MKEKPVLAISINANISLNPLLTYVSSKFPPTVGCFVSSLCPKNKTTFAP